MTLDSVQGGSVGSTLQRAARLHARSGERRHYPPGGIASLWSNVLPWIAM